MRRNWQHLQKNNNKSTWWETKELFNTIIGNFEISKQQIFELKKEIDELRWSIENTDNVLEDKEARVKERICDT